MCAPAQAVPRDLIARVDVVAGAHALGQLRVQTVEHGNSSFHSEAQHAERTDSRSFFPMTSAGRGRRYMWRRRHIGWLV